ncbi:MAG: discoidin domain-containing protein [Sedimentisphaerales bacterium]
MKPGNRIAKFVLALVFSLIFSTQPIYGAWRDAAYNQTLQNNTLEAKFQAGNLYKLTDIVTGHVFVNVIPANLPSTLYLFGSASVSLDSATNVSQTVVSGSVQTDYTWSNGTTWRITWSISGNDIVLNTSAHNNTAVGGFYIALPPCDVANYTITGVDNRGICATSQPGTFSGPMFPSSGGSDRYAMPYSFAQTMVLLFERSGSFAGWFMEGRDLMTLGPSVMRPFGNSGSTADIIASRAFPIATTDPALFEVRIRTYNGHWQDAVDPYISWMQTGLGYVPFAQKSQTWVQNIRSQAYATPTDYAALDAIEARLDPNKTYIGRQAEYRSYTFDQGYPDYNVTPAANSWVQYAASHHFNVGLHTNSGGIDRDNTSLLSTMQSGLVWDSSHNPAWWAGTDTHAYCSVAYTPWRNYLLNAIAPVVNSGAKVVYLDESLAPLGSPVVDGVLGIQGLLMYMQQIQSTYSGVALQTEGFNIMSSRYAQFALEQDPSGHQLSGYIFSRFIKIIPEGYMISPTTLANIDAFMSSGCILPGASTEPSWLEIAEAFQQYDLEPNSRAMTYPGIGANVGNGWNSSSAVVASDYDSQHYARTWSKTLDGSGISGTNGCYHGIDGANHMAMSDTTSGAARGGTVTGSHWVEYIFDNTYALGEMRIWNYNENGYSSQGMKSVTIQYSTTGSTSAGDWTMIYSGNIPQAGGSSGMPANLIVNFNGVSARYVVITTASGTDRNWSSGTYNDVGLSEVRFYPPSQQIAGFSSPDGVTAFYEKTATTRSLVVYEPGYDPEVYGLRYTNTAQWSGPGYIKDWLIYNGSTMYGLDPNATYVFDASVTLDPTRFHLTSIPNDFRPYQNDSRKIIPQEVGFNDADFRLFFSGHGTVSMYVPDTYDVYLDNQTVTVDRDTKTATVTISATAPNHSVIRAVRRSEQVLLGYWAQLPWMAPQHRTTYFSTAGTLYPPYGFFTQVAGEGFFIGKLPTPGPTGSLRVQGSWGMQDVTHWTTGDGVIRINGTEVMRISGSTPYVMHPFDVDLTSYAGQYVMMEVACDGNVAGSDLSDWDMPQIVVTKGIGNPNSSNSWSTAGAVSIGGYDSQHPTRVWSRSINGSGISGSSGTLHSNDGGNHMAMSSTTSGAARGGTVAGSHWVQYNFDQVYQLDKLQIWNYNETGYTSQGMKSVTIQYSVANSTNSADWFTLYTGNIPQASGTNGITANLTVDCNGISARYIVITTASGTDRNWSNGTYNDVGLSEVRFYQTSKRAYPAIGANANNGWNSSGVITATGSSRHWAWQCGPEKTIDGSGLSADGLTHSNDYTQDWFTDTLAASYANPHSGTYEGTHWIAYDLGQVYELSPLWIWNGNMLNYPSWDFKYVTIDYSKTGGSSSSEWTRLTQIGLPETTGLGNTSVTQTLQFRGAAARYVVITALASPLHNYTNGAYDYCVLGEVRFFGADWIELSKWPSPGDASVDTNITADLSWTAGGGATSHDVYFGTNAANVSNGTHASSEYKGNQADTSYDVGTLTENMTYYWRIDEVSDYNTVIKGFLWSFTTSE